MLPKTADRRELGRLARRPGRWHDHQPGKRCDPERRGKLIEDHRTESVSRRARSPTRSQPAGSRAGQRGRAHRREGHRAAGVDIDTVYSSLAIISLFRGNTNYADTVGLFNVVQAMNRFAQNPLDDAAFWKPAPCWPAWPLKARPSTDRRPSHHGQETRLGPAGIAAGAGCCAGINTCARLAPARCAPLPRCRWMKPVLPSAWPRAGAPATISSLDDPGSMPTSSGSCMRCCKHGFKPTPPAA